MSSGWWGRTLVYLGLKEEPEEGADELPERIDAPGPDADAEPVPGGPDHRGDVTVRPLRAATTDAPEQARVRAAVVEVREFDDVESIGARYRTGQPVLFDAASIDSATARRVLDFVSGVTYVSRGELSKVGTRAFLLIPDGLALPDDERRRLAGLGYRVRREDDA